MIQLSQAACDPIPPSLAYIGWCGELGGWLEGWEEDYGIEDFCE